jgi:hypothetical protein
LTKTLFYDSELVKGAKIYKEKNGEKNFINGPKQGDYKFVSLELDKETLLCMQKIKGKIIIPCGIQRRNLKGFPPKYHTSQRWKCY